MVVYLSTISFAFGEHYKRQGVSGVRVARYLVFCLVFCRPLFVYFCLFGRCNVCPLSIYGFFLPLWYLQTFLINNIRNQRS